MSALLKASDSLLLIVDVQERLAPHVHEHDRVIEYCEWLIGVAVERMRRHGIEIVTREMVLFEWAHRGATEQFRQLHRRFLRTPSPRGVDDQ